MIEIVEAKFGSILQKESINLRDEILRKPLGLQFTKEELALEDKEVHIVAVANEKVVGVLLLKSISKSEIKMRQVAVSKENQGKGIGAELVRFAEKYAIKKGFSMMSLHARNEPIAFYKKLNYNIVGVKFIEVGLEHYRMEKTLEIT